MLDQLGSADQDQPRCTGRVSSGGASRLPEMLLPPPNGISTASAATAKSTINCTSASSRRIDDDVRDPRNVSGAEPQQVAHALAVRVHDPVEIVLDGVLRADGVASAHPAARR